MRAVSYGPYGDAGVEDPVEGDSTEGIYMSETSSRCALVLFVRKKDGIVIPVYYMSILSIMY
jgi:hypothetical protein